MILKGKTVQEGSPLPDNPIEIKNTVLVEINNKETIELDLEKYELKEGDYFIEQNGEWYLHHRKEER